MSVAFIGVEAKSNIIECKKNWALIFLKSLTMKYASPAASVRRRIQERKKSRAEPRQLKTYPLMQVVAPILKKDLDTSVIVNNLSIEHYEPKIDKGRIVIVWS
jgi:hypothetical protein